MDSTDPKLVLLELGTFWALRGGAEYLILDQDYSRIGEFPSIRVSVEALRRCRGLEWQPA